MRLHVAGAGFSPHIFDELELLTGSAKFLVPTFQYDEKHGRVTFTIERSPFKALKRPFFGILEWAVYVTSEQVRTTVEIGHVASAEFRRSESAPTDAERFHIERGIAVSNDAVLIDSVAEDGGTKLFRLLLRVTSVDIRLDDLTE